MAPEIAAKSKGKQHEKPSPPRKRNSSSPPKQTLMKKIPVKDPTHTPEAEQEHAGAGKEGKGQKGPRKERSRRSKKRQPGRKSKDSWRVQKEALKKKFPEGWAPRKKLSPDAMAGIRALHKQMPKTYTTEVLAARFELSPEAIRRILRSKWKPSPEEEMKRQERWFNRGKQVWARAAELGMKPPRKWRAEGIVRDPSFHERRLRRHEARMREQEERLQQRKARMAELEGLNHDQTADLEAQRKLSQNMM